MVKVLGQGTRPLTGNFDMCERCPVLPTSVGHIPGLSGHNGLARDDPMRDVPGQSWNILQPGVHWMSGGSHEGRPGTVLGHPATWC